MCSASHQHSNQPQLFATAPVWVEDDARQGVIATVVLPEGVDKPLDYFVPENLAPDVEPGRRLRVPLGRGNRETLAYCVAVRNSELPQKPLKSIISVEDSNTLLSPRMLELTKWMSGRWMARWGEVLEAVLPAGVRSKRILRSSPLLVPTGITPARKLTPTQSKVLAIATTPATAKNLAKTACVSRAVVNRLVKIGLLQEVPTHASGHTSHTSSKRKRIRHDRPESLSPAQRTALDAILKPLRKHLHETIVLFGVTGSGRTEVYVQAVEETI
ncbi:MAG: primosomal protein N', partial [Pirellulales bacterium]